MRISSGPSSQKQAHLVAVNRDGVDVHLLITHPLRHVFCLQVTQGDIPFDDHGAVQILARDLNGLTDNARSGPLMTRRIRIQEKKDVISIAPAIGSTTTVPISMDIRRDRFCVNSNRTGGNKVVWLDSLSYRRSVSNYEIEWSISGALGAQEHVYGTGQRFNRVDQRGERIDLWAVDNWLETKGNSYVPVPFFLSIHGYGMFLNRFEHACLDLGATFSNRWRFTLWDAPLDMYFFLHDHPSDILWACASLTGFAPLPPAWTFGIHVCDYEQVGVFATQQGIKSTLAAMEANNLPYSSVIIEGWDTYNIDPYPEMKRVVTELHEKGKKVMVYAPYGRFPDPYFIKKGRKVEDYQRQHHLHESFWVHDLTRSAEVEEAYSCTPGEAPFRLRSRFLDLTNPHAVNWWLIEAWNKPVLNIGIDGAKIEFCEQFPESTVAIYRAYSNIHIKLQPYLVEQARISSKIGLPLLRHLFLAFPRDKAVFCIEDENLLGDALLVAPMLEAGVLRTIYFPRGRWLSRSPPGLWIATSILPFPCLTSAVSL